MIRYRLFPSLAVAFAAVTALMIVPAAHAAAPGTGEALEIAPPVLNIKANPGQTITATIQLRDVTTTPLVVRNQINDFVAKDETGTPKLLLDNTEKSPYSLKDWIQPLSEFTMKPKAINKLALTIRVPSNAAPGGYFAIVRFTASPPGLNGTGVSLSASLGTLVLLRVNGNAKESLSVAQFSATKNADPNWLFESAPISFVERIKNEGNTYEQPTGQVAISDMFGNKIAGLNVNMTTNNVLPGSIRRFTQILDKSVIGDRFLFGRYTADMKLTYGSKGQVLTASTSFWVIPYRLIVFSILLLIIAFIVLRLALRRYTERAIARSRSRRRRR
jgi:hypothetical protein